MCYIYILNPYPAGAYHTYHVISGMESQKSLNQSNIPSFMQVPNAVISDLKKSLSTKMLNVPIFPPSFLVHCLVTGPHDKRAGRSGRCETTGPLDIIDTKNAHQLNRPCTRWTREALDCIWEARDIRCRAGLDGLHTCNLLIALVPRWKTGGGVSSRCETGEDIK
jgi:hypothetical protein